jgi:hypothetical protein
MTVHHAYWIVFVPKAELPNRIKCQSTAKCNHPSTECLSKIHCIILQYSCWSFTLSPSERLPLTNPVLLSRFHNRITCAVHHTVPWCNHSCETTQVEWFSFCSSLLLRLSSSLPHQICVSQYSSRSIWRQCPKRWNIYSVSMQLTVREDSLNFQQRLLSDRLRASPCKQCVDGYISIWMVVHCRNTKGTANNSYKCFNDMRLLG